MNHSKNRIKKVVSLILGAVLVFTTFGASTFTRASSQADYSQSVKVTDVNDGTLTVTAKADKGVLPDDALLSVTPITGGSIVYDDVANKVGKAAAEDDKELSGFLAYDISFFDENGRSIEPSGNVNVTMDWEDSIRPMGADKDAEVSVLHLKDSDDSVSTSKVVDLTDDAKAVDDTNTATVRTTGSDKSVTSADMTVNSFSIFTITWTTTKDNNPSTRIGSVKVRYINRNGKELDIAQTDESTAEFSSDDLAQMAKQDGGIVDLKVWERDVTDPDDPDTQYTFDHAAIGGRNGTAITGVKIQSANETIRQQTGWEGSYPEGHATYTDVTVNSYKLYYTTEETVSKDSNWVLYRDSSSESADNNANVFLVYKSGKDGSGTDDNPNGGTGEKEFTIHYQYKDKDGTYKNAVIYKNNQSTGDSSETKTVTSKEGQVKMTPLDPVNDSQTDSWVESDVREPNGDSLIYESTRIGSATGPKVTHVSVRSDGTVVYHTSFGRRMTLNRSNQWVYTETTGELKGRTFTLTKGDDGNLTLDDSSRGEVELNYANDSGQNGGASVSASYTATLHGEVTTTEYTVYSRYDTTGTSTTPTQYYDLDVEESSPSTDTQVYQVYTPGSDNDDVLWIDDDTKYSGLYRTGISDALSKKLDKAKDIVYEWHRVTKEGSEDEKDTVVTRKETGHHYNIAYSRQDRTWLDLEADEGTDIWAYGTNRSYYVRLTYTIDGVEQKPVDSERVTVNYYGELENGGFDNPTIEGNAKYSFSGNNSNPINGYFSNDPEGDHYSDAFVWKTTAPGTGSNVNKDIEVVNTASTPTGNSNWKRSYVWTSEGNWNSYRNDGADSGSQFAELNAESAGALYQDVITHPGETLNYWFSHRARRDTTNSDMPKSGTPYDSMYLVIMPTQLAMTMGDNNSELATQDELEKFIQAHGGYDKDSATGEEDKVTYRDVDNGILIRKVSSDDNDWHKILATSGYIAKGGLTRFFFVAGKTASSRTDGRANTIGNFLDSVGFSQQLPPTTGFNITFTETFSGITMEQLAGLATNADDVDGVTKQKLPLQLTVTNRHTPSEGSSEGSPNDALNGATLGFTVSKSDSGYTITPTAQDKNGSDLFSSDMDHPGSSNVRTNSDGSITISWIFPAQAFVTSDGDEGQSERYTYSADDYDEADTSSTTDITGYKKLRSKNAVNNGSTTNGGSATATAVSTLITRNTTATLNIINVYYRETPHISVRKTFTGVTPYTVRKMMEDKTNPYSITITNKDGQKKMLKVSGNESGVSVNQIIGNNGTTSYIWTITGEGWDADSGPFTVSESNYTVDTNELMKITLNGKKVSTDDENGKKQWPEESSETTVSLYDSTQGSLSFRDSSVQSASDVSSVNAGRNINLIIGQYSDNGSEKYVVWTDSDIGYITRNAVLSQMKTLGWTDATTDNTDFFSGLNNGAVSITDGSHALRYNGTYLTLSGSWEEYYATHYYVTDFSSIEDDSEIRITNEYAPAIKIQKQDAAENSSGSHDPLNGAVFRLYRIADGVKEYYQASSGSGWMSNENKDSNPKEFTTAHDDSEEYGDGIVRLPEDLPVNDTYYLEEYKAPAGYHAVRDVPFRINDNGTVDMLDSDNNEVTSLYSGAVQMKYIDPYYTFVIQDSAGLALPETGGKGIWMYVLLGGVLVAFASVLLWRRKRQLSVDGETGKDK